LSDTADRALADARAEVARLESAMDAFLYAVSHDLGAPLRKVVSFGELLEHREGDALSDQGREFLQYVLSGGRRAQAMLGALLDYARVESRGGAIRSCSLESLCADVITVRRASIEAIGGSVEGQGELGSVEADAKQLSGLVDALLDNAIKFRSPDRPLRVTISREDDGAHVRIRVRDNGLGLSAQSLGKVLRPFGTLHAIDAYPGLGMGLTTAHAVAVRHGGGIEIEEVDEGASMVAVIRADRSAAG